jgi:hypothetical protein
MLFFTVLIRSIPVINGKEISKTILRKHVEYFNELREEGKPHEKEQGRKQRILSTHRTSLL